MNVDFELIGRNENQTVSGLSFMKVENSELRFAICIKNDGYVDDLKVRTAHQILPDESAVRSNYIRVVDETGEDYLYPSAYFVPVEVPPEAAETLMPTVS